jgi:hypothetical protein
MGLRARLSRLEQKAGESYQTLRLPDGQVIRYESEEMLAALSACIAKREHRLLQYIRRIDTNEGMPGLIRAIEGSRERYGA